jgi:hypothetical protein
MGRNTAVPAVAKSLQRNPAIAVILTTFAVLWRYPIGDTLRITSHDPLIIEFTGRDLFLDRFKKKVTRGESTRKQLLRVGLADSRQAYFQVPLTRAVVSATRLGKLAVKPLHQLLATWDESWQ